MKHIKNIAYLARRIHHANKLKQSKKKHFSYFFCIKNLFLHLTD